MNNTIQLYMDENEEIEGYPITSPDRVIDENGITIKEQLDNNMRYNKNGGCINLVYLKDMCKPLTINGIVQYDSEKNVILDWFTPLNYIVTNNYTSVFIPRGEYYVNGTINLPRFFVLEGEYTDKTRLIFKNDNIAIKLPDRTGQDWSSASIEIKNITLQGTGKLKSSIGIDSTNATVRLEKVDITQFGTGLRVIKGWCTYLYKCWITYCNVGVDENNSYNSLMSSSAIQNCNTGITSSSFMMLNPDFENNDIAVNVIGGSTRIEEMHMEASRIAFKINGIGSLTLNNSFIGDTKECCFIDTLSSEQTTGYLYLKDVKIHGFDGEKVFNIPRISNFFIEGISYTGFSFDINSNTFNNINGVFKELKWSSKGSSENYLIGEPTIKGEKIMTRKDLITISIPISNVNAYSTVKYYFSTPETYNPYKVRPILSFNGIPTDNIIYSCNIHGGEVCIRLMNITGSLITTKELSMSIEFYNK